MSGLVFFSSLIISWGVSGLISRFGEKLGIIDDPKTHNLPKVTHKYPVPRGGGLPIFLATSLTLLFTQPVSTVLVETG